jgi:hypothetical protein
MGYHFSPQNPCAHFNDVVLDKKARWAKALSLAKQHVVFEKEVHLGFCVVPETLWVALTSHGSRTVNAMLHLLRHAGIDTLVQYNRGSSLDNLEVLLCVAYSVVYHSQLKAASTASVSTCVQVYLGMFLLLQ